tara:strand:- start:3669 stop:4799 length:1131 start_codon:yes stop_codon:yes gene_type:complete
MNNFKDILDSNYNLNSFYTVSNYPVYCGVINDKNINNDIYIDMIYGISKKTGIIQILNIPHDLYIHGSHNKSIGKIWDDLFNLIVKKIFENSRKFNSIIEIGGGSGNLFHKINKHVNFNKYIMYEPNPSFEINDIRFQHINTYFSKNTYLDSPDLIIHSHLLEHIQEPFDFINNITKNMTTNSLHIFALPNMKIQIQKKYCNCIFFEHPNYLSEDYLDIIIHNSGQKIFDKIYYLDHSIIYITKKNYENYDILAYPNLYHKNIQLLNDFFNFYKTHIQTINKIINNFTHVYIFGAHIFSQFLLSFGLKSSNISYILDNDQNKHNKRLYGFNLFVRSPNIIQNQDNCFIILNVSSYKNEIKEQLYNINKTIEIFTIE